MKKKAYLEAEAVIDELAESHRKLQEKAKMAIASLKLLLEQKEAVCMFTYCLLTYLWGRRTFPLG